MKRVVQINTVANWGSTGRIAEGIGDRAIENGWESLIVYGRYHNPGKSAVLRVGTDWDIRMHGFATRILDRHGLESARATRNLITALDRFAPDIVHLHNIHGYYLNYPILFNWLKQSKVPVVWTLHDCWTFTGHCAHFDACGCYKWKTKCFHCRQLRSYPASMLIDGSRRNFEKKKEAFLGIENMVLVPVSDWLGNLLSESFLKDYRRVTIHNGIDLNTFKPTGNFNPDTERPIILGVASVWDERKGLDDFNRLRSILPDNYRIILVGLSPKQIQQLRPGIEGITRTENIGQLTELYSSADLFVNTTYEDTFPTVNLEALACGTPVITYRTGGSPESIDELTGRVVPKGDIVALNRTIRELTESNRLRSEDCRHRAESLYDRRKVFRRYIDLYDEILLKKNIQDPKS